MKVLLYWTITAILAAELFVGGIADLMRANWATEAMRHLGYPPYMMSILGFWKICATVALLVPRWPRIKEWAYAGVFFELTGAAASYLLHGDSLLNVIAPAAFSLLTVFSWLLWQAQNHNKPSS